MCLQFPVPKTIQDDNKKILQILTTHFRPVQWWEMGLTLEEAEIFKDNWVSSFRYALPRTDEEGITPRIEVPTRLCSRRGILLLFIDYLIFPCIPLPKDKAVAARLSTFGAQLSRAAGFPWPCRDIVSVSCYDEH